MKANILLFIIHVTRYCQNFVNFVIVVSKVRHTIEGLVGFVLV